MTRYFTFAAIAAVALLVAPAISATAFENESGCTVAPLKIKGKDIARYTGTNEVGDPVAHDVAMSPPDAEKAAAALGCRFVGNEHTPSI